jgi:hypothetical protein
MQRLERPLSLGEIFDRAVTLVVTTLRTTIPIAALLFFLPALVVELLRNVAHPRGPADIAFDCLTYLFGALSGVAILAVFSSAFDGVSPSRSDIAWNLRRYGLKSVAIGSAAFAIVVVGAVLLFIPWIVWRVAHIHHDEFVGALLVVATAPLAAVGLMLIEATTLFTEMTQAIMVGEGTRLRAAMACARQRLVARGLRRRNFSIALVLAALTLASFAINHWSRSLPYLSSHFVQILLGWPLGIYELGVAAVLNRELRVRLEGFDIEQRLAALSGEVPVRTYHRTTR